jgi:hypothetical protein
VLEALNTVLYHHWDVDLFGDGGNNALDILECDAELVMSGISPLENFALVFDLDALALYRLIKDLDDIVELSNLGMLLHECSLQRVAHRFIIFPIQ